MKQWTILFMITLLGSLSFACDDSSDKSNSESQTGDKTDGDKPGYSYGDKCDIDTFVGDCTEGYYGDGYYECDRDGTVSTVSCGVVGSCWHFDGEKPECQNDKNYVKCNAGDGPVIKCVDSDDRLNSTLYINECRKNLKDGMYYKYAASEMSSRWGSELCFGKCTSDSTCETDINVAYPCKDKEDDYYCTIISGVAVGYECKTGSAINEDGLLLINNICKDKKQYCVEGFCFECAEDAHCSGDRPHCSGMHSCVACSENEHCPDSKPFCNVFHVCIECRSDDDCKNGKCNKDGICF